MSDQAGTPAEDHGQGSRSQQPIPWQLTMHGAVAVLSPGGVIDYPSYEDWAACLSAARARQAKAIVLDCRSIVLLTSAGLGLLVAAMRSCQFHDIQFGLYNVMGDAARQLLLTKLNVVIPTYESRDQALRGVLNGAVA